MTPHAGFNPSRLSSFLYFNVCVPPDENSGSEEPNGEKDNDDNENQNKDEDVEFEQDNDKDEDESTDNNKDKDEDKGMHVTVHGFE